MLETNKVITLTIRIELDLRAFDEVALKQYQLIVNQNNGTLTLSTPLSNDQFIQQPTPLRKYVDMCENY